MASRIGRLDINQNHFTSNKFSDPEFLPISSSIVPDGERHSSDDMDYGAMVAKWIRPEQIQWPKESQKYPLTVFNQPHSKDILQGRLGNCWFASALSLVAGIPQVLHHVMITKQYNPTGLYKIRLCNRGVWQVITIDDLLPVTEMNSFVFTRCHKKQLFASLIEKALAKMYGSYKALDYGRCVEGLQILTGEPCEVLPLTSTDPKKKLDLNHIWNEIIQSRAKGYLMTCVSSTQQLLNQNTFDQMSLELDHAYSILDARQINNRRLVCLRNPWGTKEQAIVCNSNRWNQRHNMNQEKYSGSSENEGVFCIPWEKMSLFFSEITICKIHAKPYKILKQGKFDDFSSKIRSVYNLHCPHGAELDIELFNAHNDRKNLNGGKKLEIDLFLIIISSNGSSQAYKHSLDYYVTLSTTLPPGRYIVIAGSLSTVQYSLSSSFNLVLHGNQPFVLKEQPASCELIGHAFHAVALRANNRKEFGDGVSILTFNDNGGFGFVCENKSKQTIRFSSDFQGSTNVISLRKTLRMVDTIPPKSKLLFGIFTRKTLSEDVQIVYQIEYQTLNNLQANQLNQGHRRNNPPIPPKALGLCVLKSAQ